MISKFTLIGKRLSSINSSPIQTSRWTFSGVRSRSFLEMPD
ncbi:hypothetical protein [Coleofasciculus chthonoplastes]